MFKNVLYLALTFVWLSFVTHAMHEGVENEPLTNEMKLEKDLYGLIESTNGLLKELQAADQRREEKIDDFMQCHSKLMDDLVHDETIKKAAVEDPQEYTKKWAQFLENIGALKCIVNMRLSKNDQKHDRLSRHVQCLDEIVEQLIQDGRFIATSIN